MYSWGLAARFPKIIETVRGVGYRCQTSMKIPRIVNWIALFLPLLPACQKKSEIAFAGPPPIADFRLRQKLGILTLGGRYTAPPEARSAAFIVRFFKNGAQVGQHGSLGTTRIINRELDCEILIRGKEATMYTPFFSSPGSNELYEGVTACCINSSAARLVDLPMHKGAYVLGFLSSNRNSTGHQFGVPEFKYHLEKATDVAALFVMTSPEDRVPEGFHPIEAIDFGIEPHNKASQPSAKPEAANR